MVRPGVDWGDGWRLEEISMLVLYHASHSTCSQKVCLVLHEKGLMFDEVRLEQSAVCS
jgi:hypothetical protein